MNRTFCLAAGILGASAVAIGAFAAHGLKQSLPAEGLTVIETAVRYQMYHALAVLVLGMKDDVEFLAAGRLFIAGTVLFSGSLYTLVYTGVKQVGIITPVGGALLIAAWLAIAFQGLRRQRIHAGVV